MLPTLLIAVSLAVDAFAVSVSTGIAVPGFGLWQAIQIGAWCGAFQFSMPLLGWLLGSSVRVYIEAVDHWIAFGLLAFIGGRMIAGTLLEEENRALTELSVRQLCILALATSVDALAVGISLAFTHVNILVSAAVIGGVAFVLSLLGGLLGRKLGSLFRRWAALAGGVVLIGIGLRILLEHLSAI